jgi:hypothetical protein
VNGVRAVLIGGTSHVGKSTVARALAASLGWRYLSTDRLARHPGRPWDTVPPHVRRHYLELSVEELTAAQLEHYERMWPLVEAIVTEAVTDPDRPGRLVLEGSGIWPDRVAALPSGAVAAFWLVAADDVLERRIRLAGGRAGGTNPEPEMIDKFVGRTIQYNARLLAALAARGIAAIDVSEAPAVDRLVERIRRTPQLPP